MKKLLILSCVLLLIGCMAKKATIKTEGLEEVVVFGEDTTQAPKETLAVPPITLPPAEEKAVAPPVLPPPAAPLTSVTEEPVIALPPSPTVAATPPPSLEIPSNLPTEEIAAASAAPPAAEEVAAALPSLPPTPTVAPTPSAAAAPTGPQGSVYGFRVQIFASSTEKNAMKIAEDARAVFSGRVYIEHAAPYYKVRIGDCLTKEDAEVMKAKANSLGYRGAFIVETMINP